AEEDGAAGDVVGVGGPLGDGDPGAAVGVEEEVGVEAGEVGEEDGVGPGAGGVLGPDDEVAALADGVADDVEASVVVAEGGGVDEVVGEADALEVELARAVDRVPDQAPVDEVAAVVDGQAGEPTEGGGGEVVVVADAADG